jgi:lactoylglutathione lyase
MRAFPIIYVRDVEGVADFYKRFGFEERFRLEDPDGTAGFISMVRTGCGLAVTTEESPRMFAGVEPGPGPRHEMWIYVADADEMVDELRDAGQTVIREPAMMPWGERVGYVADPEGNLVAVATVPDNH